MASKKSKVLAIAFCAAVMAGIHVNPVLAAEIPVNNGSVTVRYKDFETTPGTGYVEEAKVTITNIASQDEVKQAQQTAEDAATLAGDALYTAKGVKDDLAQETADREKKDAEHDSAIKNETLDREAADREIKADLQADINAKEEQSKDRDSQLQADIEAEEDAREAADSELNTKIEAEEDAREAADSELNTKIEAEEDAREAADSELNTKIEAEEDAREAADSELNTKIEAEEDAREAADSELNTKIEAEEDAREAADSELNTKIEAEEDAREAADSELNTKIEAEEDAREAADTVLNNKIENVKDVVGVSNTEELHNAYSGTNYISDAENMAEADVILDREISRVDGRVDRLEDRIDKVGAMAAAIANLRTMGYDPAAPTEVAVGVGQYRDETGMALGLFHYPNRDFMLSLSVSTSGDEYMGGIGATWKFGRKSPEKVAEIKKAQAEADARRAEEQKLAKAEEMKKAAKEAKVQAQMERHAKLAAERAALEEA